MRSKQQLYTTIEIAVAENLPRTTLQHWIKTGKISAPSLQLVGGKATRLWTLTQREQIRRLKGRLRPGPKPRLKLRTRRQTKTLHY